MSPYQRNDRGVLGPDSDSTHLPPVVIVTLRSRGTHPCPKPQATAGIQRPGGAAVRQGNAHQLQTLSLTVTQARAHTSTQTHKHTQSVINQVSIMCCQIHLACASTSSTSVVPPCGTSRVLQQYSNRIILVLEYYILYNIIIFNISVLLQCGSSISILQ